MKNIPRSLPSNSFHVIAPLALFAVPENSFPRYKTGARKCTPNRVFFQKSSQSLCLLPISLYQPRREKGSPRGKPIPLEPNPPSPPLLVAHPLRGNRFNRLASVVHLIVSSPGVTNRNPEEGGGEEKSEKYPRRNGKRSGRRRGWKKFDGYIGEGKLDFRFADNSPRLRSRRIGDESCIPPVREYASTD